jgi:photosystem II oxygen-evolving enhancer protein 3
MLSLLAASVAGAVLVKEASAATSIKLEGPPPPSGGLPGTENADQARDTDLPLKERFFIQPLSPTDAAQRAKFSAQDIIAVKSLIDKKAWPYVQNGLRSSAGYLRYDLNTVISSKTSKDEKKYLKALSAQLFDSLNALDYAARSKSTKDANKYYSQTIKLLDDVLNKIA